MQVIIQFNLIRQSTLLLSYIEQLSFNVRYIHGENKVLHIREDLLKFIDAYDSVAIELDVDPLH